MPPHPRRRLEEERRPPPPWKPAPERPHKFGLFHEASDEDWERAEIFCRSHPSNPPRLLPSNSIDRIRLLGCAAWGLERSNTTRFVGRIERNDQKLNKPSGGGGTWKVCTQKRCEDTCVMSDLPLMAGHYDIHSVRGIYYEVRVIMMEGVVAIGTFRSLPRIPLARRARFSQLLAEKNLKMKIVHMRYDRYDVQATPILAHARMESSQRRIAPRRSAQVLRGCRRRSRLHIFGAFTNLSGGRRRLRIRVRHRRAVLHAQWTPLAERVCWHLHAARRPRRVRCDWPRGRE